MRRALMLALAACGTPPVDVPQPDGPFVPGSVSIVVTLRGAPAVNVPVVFQNADSSVTRSTATDIEGRATGEIDGDAFVTVLEPREPSAPRQVLSTFAGVQGDDELHLDLAPLGATEARDFALAIPQDTSPDALGGYRVLSPCGPVESFTFAGDPMPPTTQLIGCGDTADLLVLSLDEFGAPLRSQFHPAVPLSGTQTLSGTYVDVGDATLEYRNIPAQVGFIGAYRAFAIGDGVVFDITAGVSPDTGMGSAPIPVPMLTGATAITASSVTPAFGEVSSQLVYDWEPLTDGEYTVDLDAAMLSRYIERPVFDVARRTATWAEADGGLAGDAVRIHLQLFRPMIPMGTAWEWRMVAPRAGASVTFPELPGDLTGFNFNAGSNDTVGVRALTTVKLPAGYDRATRERGFVPFIELRAGDSGRIVTQDLFDAEPEL